MPTDFIDSFCLSGFSIMDTVVAMMVAAGFPYLVNVRCTLSLCMCCFSKYSLLDPVLLLPVMLCIMSSTL